MAEKKQEEAEAVSATTVDKPVTSLVTAPMVPVVVAVVVAGEEADVAAFHPAVVAVAAAVIEVVVAAAVAAVGTEGATHDPLIIAIVTAVITVIVMTAAVEMEGFEALRAAVPALALDLDPDLAVAINLKTITETRSSIVVDLLICT